MFNDTHEDRPSPQLKTIVKINDCMKPRGFRSAELRDTLALLNGFIPAEGKALFP